ncbi:MAG: hypothetical protein A3B96_03535 [Candidatus Spechtbacteria bacterium RIFCSPHIGHO2_02_FULL_43_15b]|uniref:Nitroreductase domain-containing protein n=1 Tax=Candidatus Spechtbacteria bacterium RIFCSPHIGHO2_01_FULL_43_30 TaxID=1802158 RepID=A0A1G2H7E7_9BACT|nr:MAG: hypothetical protein A2827_00165 [Candidatus Spechtbacteria bacterium RIFCSPHIGHO2_01_FULL_43_30]OGZ59793.1 MAG: hypothetical protein A3B96_03535 [Candidatus Spechtbacteria bacterium RIFCSPHIGHO2_02_FULL_43_15b]
MNKAKKNSNYDAWGIERLKLPNADIEKIYRNIVGWTILAPSSHNSQPWKFKIHIGAKSDSISILIDKSRILRESDKYSRQTFISLGCALANLTNAADYYGLHYTVKIPVNSSKGDESVIISISKKDAKINNRFRKILDSMKTRTMNRGNYLDKAIPKIVLRKFYNIAENGGLRLTAIMDQRTKNLISELQFQADLYAIADTKFRKELARFILSDKSDEFIGMPAKTIKLSEEMGIYISKKLSEKLFDADISSGFAASNRDAMRNSPGIFVISSPKDSVLSWIKAGQIFENIALIAEQNGLAISVYAAIIESMRDKIFQKNFFNITSDTQKVPLVLFRAGYSKQSYPHSPRIPSDLLTQYSKD